MNSSFFSLRKILAKIVKINMNILLRVYYKPFNKIFQRRFTVILNKNLLTILLEINKQPLKRDCLHIFVSVKKFSRQAPSHLQAPNEKRGIRFRHIC